MTFKDMKNNKWEEGKYNVSLLGGEHIGYIFSDGEGNLYYEHRKDCCFKGPRINNLGKVSPPGLTEENHIVSVKKVGG